MEKQYDRLYKVHDNQIDLIFLVDASPSSLSQIRVPQSDGTIKNITRLEIISDVIKKISTLHDCNIMPGTDSFGHGDKIDCPPIDYNKNVPPWGAASGGGLLDEEGLNNMSPRELKRFSVRIEGQHVNIGVVKISSKEDCEVMSSILDYPQNMDRHALYKNLESGIDPGDGKDYLTATRKALYELFFSARARQVKKRFLFYIGDGYTDAGREADGILGLTRDDRIFSYRRPLDINLRRDFIISNQEPQEGTHLRLPTRYSGADKQEWYKYPVKTSSFFIGMGNPKGKGIAPEARKYAFDYESRPELPVGYIELTDGNNPDKEFKRILGVVNMVDRLCYDTGFENLYSITLHNCGPHEVNLLNTIINFELDENSAPEDSRSDPDVGATRWRTETLKQGIIKGNDLHDMQFLSSGAGGASYGYMAAGVEDGSILQATDQHQMVFEATPFDDPADRIGALNLDMIVGNGGQFYNDPLNRDYLEDINSNYNILWHSFNTQYEVYRRGVLYNINGGWANNWLSSKGVRNDGVAFRGMPVRVFRSQTTGLEVVDYNIGNVSKENGYMGDYSHLPLLMRGQEIDLFFGVRMNNTMPVKLGYNAIVEGIQMVFNGKDKTMNNMQAYANMHFDLTCEMPYTSTGRSADGIGMYLPYPPGEFQDEPKEEPRLELPIYGTWTIDIEAGYFLPGSQIKVTLPRYPVPNGGVDKDGNVIGSTEDIMVGSIVLEHNIPTGEFDLSGFWSAVAASPNVMNEDGTDVVATLNPGSLADITAYASSPSTLTSAPNTTYYHGAEFTYYVQTGELYIMSSTELLSGSQATEPPPPHLKINDKVGGSPKLIKYDLAPAVADLLGKNQITSPNTTYSCFQFYIANADFPTLTDVPGKMNDVLSAFKSGGHGRWLIPHQTWADLTDYTVEPDLSDPASSTLWVSSNFKTITMSKQ
jgi:hypothetical protein